MLAPTEGSLSGVVTGPRQTQSAETLPEIVCMPAAARCVCHITTDPACGGRREQCWNPLCCGKNDLNNAQRLTETRWTP